MTNQDDHKEALTPEKFFKKRFISLIADLGKNARKDMETVWLIGSLAGSILNDAKSPSWASFKSSLSGEAYDRLLTALKTQGNQLAEKGHHKSAYAVETIAISVIAPTMAKDKHIAKGNELLDKMISDAIDLYHKNPAQKYN